MAKASLFTGLLLYLFGRLPKYDGKMRPKEKIFPTKNTILFSCHFPYSMITFH